MCVSRMDEDLGSRLERSKLNEVSCNRLLEGMDKVPCCSENPTLPVVRHEGCRRKHCSCPLYSPSSRSSAAHQKGLLLVKVRAVILSVRYSERSSICGL